MYLLYIHELINLAQLYIVKLYLFTPIRFSTPHKYFSFTEKKTNLSFCKNASNSHMLNLAFLMSCLFILHRDAVRWLFPPSLPVYIIYSRTTTSPIHTKCWRKDTKKKPVHKQWILSLLRTWREEYKEICFENRICTLLFNPLPNCVLYGKYTKTYVNVEYAMHSLIMNKEILLWMFVPSFVYSYLYLLFSIIEMVLNSNTYTSFVHINCIHTTQSTWCALKKILPLFHVFNP